MILQVFLCSKKPFEKVLGSVLKASGPSAWWVDVIILAQEMALPKITVQLHRGSAVLHPRAQIWASPPTLALVKLVGRGGSTYLALHGLKSPVQHFGGRHRNSVAICVPTNVARQWFTFCWQMTWFWSSLSLNKIVSSKWAGSYSCSPHLGFRRAPAPKPLPQQGPAHSP